MIHHSAATHSESNTICKPTLYLANNPVDIEELQQLFEDQPHISLVDEIDGQLQELLKLRHPKKKFTATELDKEIRLFLDGRSPDNYGVYVYYPWLHKVVHVLAESDFIEVRTNRNHYKITPQEEQILHQKKIGVIGLSVGKAIALTIATERICGELVIADFDVIELSNLNRIQTGVQHLNTKKTIVVAREIAEIDPFLKVTCYHEGLTEENLEAFLTDGGKMDVCIEVCDGLLVKIQTRQKAKELGIPVVMNSSDRGTTDVERYDLDPDWPIFHGLIDHLDLSKVKEAKTNEEKVPYLLPMIGIDTASERLRASILEIEGSITTWPQLASGVIFGGGICTDVCRRLLLNQYTKSGRYIVDVESIINDDVENDILTTQLEEYASDDAKINLDDYKEELQLAQQQLLGHSNHVVKLSVEEITTIVTHAIQAPSGGNVQPWNWVYQDGNLLLLNDEKRSDSILNYRNTGSLLSFGAAIENLELAALTKGYSIDKTFFPLGDNNQLIASIRFHDKNNNPSNHLFPTLSDYIFSRCTNRNLGVRQPIDAETYKKLAAAVSSVPHATLKIFDNPTELDQFKLILSEIDKLFMTNQVGHAHFTKEIRWSKEEAESTRDGIDINTIDLTATEKAGLVLSKNWNVTKHIKKWGLGNEFGKLTQKAVDSASSLGMITMPSRSAMDYVQAGIATQRLWLMATAHELALQPMSISSFLFARIDDGDFSGIEEIETGVTEQYVKFKTLTSLQNGEKDLFFFRLSKAETPAVYALRRPVEDVLLIK